MQQALLEAHECYNMELVALLGTLRKAVQAIEASQKHAKMRRYFEL